MRRSLVTEAAWQRVVTDALTLHGWEWLHVHPLLTRDNEWRTPTSGSLAVGWVDLLAIHPRHGRILFIELKASRGVLSDGQRRVAELLIATGLEYYCWRPSDLPAVLDVLRGPRTPERAA